MSLPANRLVRETSPYLLQHAHNPVDWYPWGKEAFDRAKAEAKPIFLSVGYSTCYWCHVMERQCFENEAIAALMNEYFVCIKVDREERPDVDQLYMTAIQIMTRQGGWPMSVWLTPDGLPFYGGTYFPPVDSYGRSGFPSLLQSLADAWKNRRSEVDASAKELSDLVRSVASESDRREPKPDPAEIDKLVLRCCEDYEPGFGGFGRSPKFPRETLLRMLLTWIEGKPADDPNRAVVEKQIRHTLDAMANGGIRDHLGGGFHRYSTDAQWLVPHFEIMLYDQAMLAPVYARASRIFDEPRYARVARGICDFVLREMTSDAGAFYTAWDAEVDAREGQNYLWTPQQIEEAFRDFALKPDVDWFMKTYGVDRGFNFADPHHSNGVPHANILFLPDGPGREGNTNMAKLRERLLAHRELRKKPLLDTKVLTSWNALMIEALAICAPELNEPIYRDAAIRAADFLLTTHRTDGGALWRSSRDGDLKHEAFLDDYAGLAVALQELATATSDRRWQTAANLMLDEMLKRFAADANESATSNSEISNLNPKNPESSASPTPDPAGPASFPRPRPGALFFNSRTSTDLFARQKTITDSPLPSGNALACLALLRAGRIDFARGIVEDFSFTLRRNPEAVCSLLEATLLHRAHGKMWTANTGDLAGVGWMSPDELSPEQIVACSATRIGPRRIDLRVAILHGYHLYDTNLDSKLGLTATRVRVAPALAELVESIDYPPAGQLTLPYGPPVRGYNGTIEIAVRFRDDLRPEPVEVSLSYQACDDKACLLPNVSRCEA